MNQAHLRQSMRALVAIFVALLGAGFAGTGCMTTVVPDETDMMNDDMGDGMQGDDDVDTNGEAVDNRTLAVFEDPDSDFTTDTVRDVDGETMQCDTSTGRLIWLADGSEHAGWNVQGNALNSGFQVRFGTEESERRAYFTEVSPPTICDLSVFGTFLSIRATSVEVPQE